jgi:hypothetical protein
MSPNFSASSRPDCRLSWVQHLSPAATENAIRLLDGRSSSATAKSYEVVATPTRRDDAYAYVGWAFFLDESGVICGAPYGKNNGYRVASKSDQPIRQQ